MLRLATVALAALAALPSVAASWTPTFTQSVILGQHTQWEGEGAGGAQRIGTNREEKNKEEALASAPPPDTRSTPVV